MSLFPSHPPETSSNTVTSWLPMTTVFPYQTGCSSQLWSPLSSSGAIMAFDPAFDFKFYKSQYCGASQVESSFYGSVVDDEVVQGFTRETTRTVYEIGPFVCPEAYTTASTWARASDSTDVACCPSNYNHDSTVVTDCFSVVPAMATLNYWLETAKDNFTVLSTAIPSQTTVWGFLVRGVNFNGQDPVSANSSTSTTLPASAPVPNPTNPSLSPQITKTMYSTVSAAVQPSITPTANSQTSSKISRGAMAGIGVGVTLGVIALFGLGAWLMLLVRRRRRLKNPAQDIPGEMTWSPEWRRELPALDVRFEMGPGQTVDLSSARFGTAAHDRNSRQAPQELPSPETLRCK